MPWTSQIFFKRTQLPPNKPLICDSIRQQTENVLFGDIEFALSKTVEERLWTHAHYRVIDDYRKRIANVLSPLLCAY